MNHFSDRIHASKAALNQLRLHIHHLRRQPGHTTPVAPLLAMASLYATSIADAEREHARERKARKQGKAFATWSWPW